ncbi:MAG: hypothetical protein IT210_09360 [Armatimonadetes bacterium]|nr:hypothetical protein [Armatimonadota bacterium]
MTANSRRLIFACLALAAVAYAGPQPPGEVPLMRKYSFGPELKGWIRQGEAEFAADPSRKRDTLVSARITVATGAALQYQQLRREFSADIRPKDTYRARVWVMTGDIAGGLGAYLALEFRDRSGQRIGIAHSRIGKDAGKNGWKKLEADGPAPAGTKSASIVLVVHACGTAWFADPQLVRASRAAALPNLGDAVRKITVNTLETVQPHFGGVGFHAFHHFFRVSQEEMDQVIYKRWRELNPSFARINHHLSWTPEDMDRVAEHLLKMKATGTELYLASWDPPVTRPGQERADYARKAVDSLAYFVQKKGLTNIRYYCMSNELSLDGWGALASDLPTFKDYHQALHNELKARKLDIELLATDASPVEYWGTLEWAAANMDDITGIYGAHHYINNYDLNDPDFYPWFASRLQWATALAKSKKKEFILGEFGSKQDGRTIDGVKRDVCIYFDTPQEALVPVQTAEAVIASLNAGVYALGYWTFMDCPDDGFRAGYINKWGLYRSTGADRSTRSLYYSYGLLSRYFRGPSSVVAVKTDDPLLRAAAVRHHGKDTLSVAVVNRNAGPVKIALTLQGDPVKTPFRKYLYNPARVPQHPFGDLPGPDGTIAAKDGLLSDTLPGGTLVVYTTAYDSRPPAPVQGLKVVQPEGGRHRLIWQPNPEPDLCYYRIYRDGRQVGSTIATEFTAPEGDGPYRIVAVDQSGNTSE